MKPVAALSAEVEDPELRPLLDPAAAYDHPQDVLGDPDLTQK